MTKDDITGMLRLLGASLIIDRCHLPEYGGLFREIEITSENSARVDFIDREGKLQNEGGLSVHFTFESFDTMICELERYTAKDISEWKRCFTTPDIIYGDSEEWSMDADWQAFADDYKNGRIREPTLEGFCEE